MQAYFPHDKIVDKENQQVTRSADKAVRGTDTHGRQSSRRERCGVGRARVCGALCVWAAPGRSGGGSVGGDPRMSRRRTKKALAGCQQVPEIWSERLDSNQRPPAPKAGALPNCATLRCGSYRRKRQAWQAERQWAQGAAGPWKQKTPQGCGVNFWGERRGLNPRPPGPQPGALPTELLPPCEKEV